MDKVVIEVEGDTAPKLCCLTIHDIDGNCQRSYLDENKVRQLIRTLTQWLQEK